MIASGSIVRENKKNKKAKWAKRKNARWFLSSLPFLLPVKGSHRG